ncbi:MAG: SIMPL domain-containing protein [Candidatus Taylorbacteria bacterium]|nr:SIMPL domain-containing protein [Candidatus Taylorbacteria bacterium]
MDTTIRKSPLVALGIVIGASIVLSALIGAFALYKVRSFDDALSVTGSARVRVTSDQAKWTASISRQVKASSLRSGYALLAADLEKTLSFYKTRGVAEESLVVSPVSMNEVYDYRPGSENREKEYDLRQTISLSTSDVAKAALLAKESQILPMEGVIFQTQSLEYSYSKLPELRVSLLSDAIKDAKARAEKLAEPSGQSVGTLKSASLGVVQVMAANSTDVSDYGTYDTSNVEKEVMVTVRAAFTIR